MNKSKYFFVSIVLIVLFLVSLSYASEFFVIDGISNSRSVNLKKALVTKGSYGQDECIENYFLFRLYDFDNQEIPGSSYKICYEGGTDIYNFNLPMRAPYVEDAKIMSIEDDQGNLLGNKYIGYLARVCGNGNCDEHESYCDCPSDCQGGRLDDCCDELADGECDPDCLNIAPPEEPFGFDPDCGVPPDFTYPCDGTLFCYENAGYYCVYDKSINPHVFLYDVCEEEEICENGFCGGDYDIIYGHVCQKDADCIVNGDPWWCVCPGVCIRPNGLMKPERCCNERLDE